MIDNIFINNFKNENYSVYFLINGLSDHDGQVRSLSDITVSHDRNGKVVYTH
jgi:sRNA-binding regulator protein Hfq